MPRPVLIVVSGLPAAGKSTVAGALAGGTGTPYLRVDRIEQTIVAWTDLVHPVGPVGYAVAHQLATEQLSLGLDCIVECVNPSELTRDPWVNTARSVDADLVEVELVCSDVSEHQRRVEHRTTDVEGLAKPTWEEVRARAYEPWTRPHLVLDSAATSVPDLVDAVTTAIASARGR